MNNMEFSPQERILSVLFVDPQATLTLRDVAKESKLSPATIAKYIKEMTSEKLISVKERKNAFDITLEHNETTKQLHRIYNLRSILTCEIVQELQEKLSPECIVLTGAYAKGEDDAKSNIEIMILNGKDVNINLSKYNSKLKRNIVLKIIKTQTKDIKNDLANGIVLAGQLVIA